MFDPKFIPVNTIESPPREFSSFDVVIDVIEGIWNSPFWILEQWPYKQSSQMIVDPYPLLILQQMSFDVL